MLYSVRFFFHRPKIERDATTGKGSCAVEVASRSLLCRGARMGEGLPHRGQVAASGRSCGEGEGLPRRGGAAVPARATALGQPACMATRGRGCRWGGPAAPWRGLPAGMAMPAQGVARSSSDGAETQGTRGPAWADGAIRARGTASGREQRHTRWKP